LDVGVHGMKDHLCI